MLPVSMLYVKAGAHLSSVKSLKDIFSFEIILILFLLAFLPYFLKTFKKNS